MVALVDHLGDEAAAGGAPVDLLADAEVVADLLQGAVHLATHAADRGVHMRLVHLLPLEHWKDVVHVTLGPVAFDELGRLVDQHDPGHAVELDALVNDHAVLDPIPLQVADVDGRHPTGVVAE